MVFITEMIDFAVRKGLHQERERIANILENSEAVYTTDYGDGSSLDWDKSMRQIAEKIKER